MPLAAEVAGKVRHLREAVGEDGALVNVAGSGISGPEVAVFHPVTEQGNGIGRVYAEYRWPYDAIDGTRWDGGLATTGGARDRADWLTQAGAELAADPAGDDLSQEPALRSRVAAYWYTYRAHLPEIRALGEAAQADPAFAESLAAMRRAGLATMRRHLERLRDTGHALPGDPAVLASAFNALLEGFCQVWIAGGGEPIGRPLSDEEAIDTLTRLLMHGQRQDRG
jgi:hypothetical protein